MKFYCDTSFLFSLYVEDKNSAKALAFLRNTTEPFPFTSLNRIELFHAVRLAVFREKIPVETSRAALNHITDDLESGGLLTTPLTWSDVLKEFENLSQKFGCSIGARTMDVLQVATAVALGAKQFLSFDHRQLDLARKAGLKVAP